MSRRPAAFVAVCSLLVLAPGELGGSSVPALRALSLAAGHGAENVYFVDVTEPVDANAVVGIDAAVAAAYARLQSGEPTQERRRHRAVADAVLGRVDQALDDLLDIVHENSQSAESWSDLSGVLLMSARSHPLPARQNVRALDAALRSIQVAASPESWMNLAEASSRLGLTTLALRALTQAEEAAPRSSVSLRARMKAGGLRRPPLPYDGRLVSAVFSDEAASPTRAEMTRASQTAPQQVREFVTKRLLRAWAQEVAAGSARVPSLTTELLTWGEVLQSETNDSLMLDCANSVARLGARAVSAVLDYQRGADLYERGRHGEALVVLKRASVGLATLGSPCKVLSDAQLVMAVRQVRGPVAALPLADDLVRESRRLGYRSFEARAQVVRAVAVGGSGRMDDAAAAWAAAAELYAAAGEALSACSASRGLADVQRTLGDYVHAWTALWPSIKCLSQEPDPTQRYLVHFESSLLAAEEGYPLSALRLQEAAIEAARERGVSSMLREAVVRHARLLLASGAATSFDGMFDALPDAEADQSYVYYNETWARRVNAESALIRGEPRRALLLLTPAMFDFFSAQFPEELPALYLLQGRALALEGEHDAADRAWAAGLDVAEARLRTLRLDQHQVAYLDQVWDLYSERIKLRIDRSQARESLHLAERARLNSVQLSATASKVGPFSSAKLEPGERLLVYLSLPDRLVRWTVGNGSVGMQTLPVTRSDLGRVVQRFRRSVAGQHSEGPVGGLSTELYRTLLGDEDLRGVERLLVAPDGAVGLVPFAALTIPGTSRFLVEDVEIGFVVEHSARRVDSALPRSPRPAVFVAGVDDTRALELDTELTAIAGVYAPSETERLDAPTASGMRAIAERAAVLHFGGHGFSNAVFPWRSYLALRPDADHPTGALSAAEISTWSLSRVNLVVLAACETAVGADFRGEGVISLARPLLLAGAAAVVGSMWAVEDRSTRAQVLALHTAYRTAADPVTALRAAQLASLRATDPTERLIRNWAAFTVVVRLRPLLSEPVAGAAAFLAGRVAALDGGGIMLRHRGELIG